VDALLKPEPMVRKPVRTAADGTGKPYSVVELKPADRTVGDTSPTGIGRKPSGEELLTMQGTKRSRLDALRREAEKEDSVEGLHDEVEQDGKTLQGILQRPPEGHAIQGVPDSSGHLTAFAPPGLDAGGLAGLGVMTAVMLVEAGRRVHDMVKHGKEVTLCQ
jgi:hypothetical protein